jgi:outer membrane protein assembly factor BamA
MPVGEPYRPVLRENALERLQQLYWSSGYNDVETQFIVKKGAAEHVDITFKIAENRQAIVQEILVEGREKTSENMIRTQLELKTGEPLDLQKLAASRRNLYNTGAYSLIDISREEITEEGGEQTRTRTTGSGQKPMRLRVKVREVQPFEVRYGGFFDTERGPGGIVDLSNRNSLGSARVAGMRLRYDRQLREGRVYFSQPALLRFPVKTIASPYIRMERNPATTDADPFNVDRVGFSVQQEAQWPNKEFVLNYGYRIERTRTYDPSPEALFDVPLRIAALTLTSTRETRDEILDATRGVFFSNALQFSPSVLGSEIRFIKSFSQFFKYIPLQRERVELFTGEVLRPRLVYAGGIRLGLAKGFGGQEVPLAERFFAGGGTSVRGFEQNSLGPVGVGRQPRGGQAMLVINNEVRFPTLSIFDGVGFVDIGNVYERVSELSFGDLRKAGGVGVRVRTPWFLIRVDYGMKLDRRAGESRGRVFFSIGQAF